MAVFTYGANNISFESFTTWSNNITQSTNIELSIALNDFDPAIEAPFQVSDIAPSTSIFYGVMYADTGGTIELTAPYTVASTQTIPVKNFLISSYSLTVVASANYPYVFHSWRTATDGGGESISTSATLTLTDTDHTDVTEFYAYFTTSHIDPTDTNF
jgi:hypothetical protein